MTGFASAVTFTGMSKEFSLSEIATALDARLEGDGALRVTRLAHPADITSAGDLALAMDAKLLPLLKDGKAIAAIVDEKGAPDSGFLKARIIVPRPRVALAKLTALFAEPVIVKQGIHPSAVIEPSAKIGRNAAIGAQVYIGDNVVVGDNAVIHPQVYIGDAARIGDNALIYAGVKIGAGSEIGKNFIVHFNSSIGADGFSFVTPQIGSVEAAKAGSGGEVTASNTALIRIASLAPVIIGDDVEIGANSSIDRGTIASTRIGNGTKIDNQVQIGHNVRIGENCMICGRVGIAGSAVIGDRVVLGGAVGVADHVTVGDDAIAMAMSGIAGKVAARSIVGGIPALPRERLMENLFNQGRIKQLFKKTDDLAEKLARLEKKAEND
ncbi:MAG: UDP-3-O-(3-hydroxymyristoyl)glucosamine N-acyltransferase [Alphaproteobacteria bacterium]|nr:UDP-3-O-(3-hydroxymyristoyl)glucosamine N-acyltransferase [Alphaproteobacteria bacterium]